MRLRRSPWTRGSAAVLTVALVMNVAPPTVWASSTAPSGDFEQSLVDADAHADAGRHDQALQAYADAFEAMPNELKITEVGEFVVLAAAKAATADYEAQGDPASLRQARTVLTQFIELASAAEAGTASSVDAATARLALIDAAMPPPDDSEPIPDPVAEEPEPVETPLPPEEPRSRRPLAIGLLAGGAVAALAGVGLVVAGIRQVPWYEQKLEDGGWLPTDVGYGNEIAAAERIRNINLALGISVLVVGLGVSAGGGVLLARENKNNKARASMVPSLQRNGGGLAVRVDF